jgi:hypothetical protein
MVEYPKITADVEIEYIRQIDESVGFSSTFGYFAKGHWDARSFVIACNKRFDLAASLCWIPASDVTHVWYRKVSPSDGVYRLVGDTASKVGAFEVTRCGTCISVISKIRSK